MKRSEMTKIQETTTLNDYKNIGALDSASFIIIVTIVYKRSRFKNAVKFLKLFLRFDHKIL